MAAFDKLFDDNDSVFVPKGTFLLREGEICKSAYFVIKGCLKSYIIDQNGKEIILQFAPENWVVSDLESIINKVKTQIYIETIEDSEIKQLHLISDFNLKNSSKEDLIAMNEKFVRNIISMNRRLISVLSTNAIQRYNEFVKTYPSLVQRIPLKQIASFIGITPEYLSEIRRSRSGK